MEILVPFSAAGDWCEKVVSASSQDLLPPFHPVALHFVATVSKRLLLDPITRSMPELMAVGHWMRMIHLKELEQTFRSRNMGQVRLARGVVTHFAPSNVDSIFLYSWLLSLLMGNCNIVRLSTRRGPQISHVFQVLNAVIQDPEFSDLRERNVVLSYEHDNAITASICERCNTRVLWGGDRTIADLRRIPIQPLATELAFADRFSMAALKASAVLDLDAHGLEKLLQRFFNDAFWFGQAACSSPRLIVWVGGKEESNDAQIRFWEGLRIYVRQRGINYPTAVTIDRMETIYSCAALGEIQSAPAAAGDFPGRARLQPGANRFREFHRGGGLFFEVVLPSLVETASLLTDKDQTLCYFGFDRSELERFAGQLPARSIDRIVPIGEALAFSHVWDGTDLLDAFTRQVSIY